MNDEIAEETQAKAQDEPNQDTLDKHPPVGHLPQRIVWVYTVGYGTGGILIGIAFAVFGFNAAHINFGIGSLILGLGIFAGTAVFHYRRAGKADGVTTLEKNSKIPWPFIRGLILPMIWVFGFLAVAGLTMRCGYEIGYERAKRSFIPATPTNITKELGDGRILLVDVTPEYLDYLFREHTSNDAKRMMEPYWDKWLSFAGSVDDVDNYPNTHRTYVRITRPDPFWAQSMIFTDVKQIERLQPLKRGNPVTVRCKITRPITSRFNLTDCELLDE